MRGGTVGRVLASKSSQVKEGDYVSTMSGWTEIAILKEGQFDPASNYPGLKEPQDLLSVLGLTGITAWAGMTQIGEPKPGELVVVSGAAGATGSVAAQIAKLKGARVIGIAGSDDKCKWLTEDLGLDGALNYKDPDFKKKFKEATKDFIDVYFDNGKIFFFLTPHQQENMSLISSTVGGEILDMALGQAKPFSRFVECGVISQYNKAAPEGPRNIARVIQMRIKMQGFIVFDYEKQYPQARKDLAQWLGEGKLKKTEHILKGGLKVAEQGLVDLYKGINTGKLLVEIKNPSESPSKL